MKKMKLIRWLGILLVLALVLIPATPAMAANDITVSATSGEVGNSVTITGTNFTPSSAATERFATVLFGYNNISTTTWKTTLTSYKEISGDTIGYQGDADAGRFSITFEIPSLLNSGSVSHTVTSGTYYMYIVIYRLVTATGDVILDDYIYAKASITITAGDITISPVTGKVGSTLSITGSGFPASTAIAVTFGGTAVALSGNTTRMHPAPSVPALLSLIQ